MSQQCTPVFFKGDFGKKIGANFVEDDCCGGPKTPLSIADAESTTIVFVKPETNTAVTVTAVWADFPHKGQPAAGDGSDGRIMALVTSPTFFDEEGTWYFQGFAAKSDPDGYDHATSVEQFEVKARLGG